MSLSHFPSEDPFLASLGSWGFQRVAHMFPSLQGFGIPSYRGNTNFTTWELDGSRCVDQEAKGVLHDL